MRDRPNDEAVIEYLRKRPDVAAELLNLALKENNPEDIAELTIIFRQIIAAGYTMSITPKPTPRKQTKQDVTKKATRHPTSRGKTRRSAAAIA